MQKIMVYRNVVHSANPILLFLNISNGQFITHVSVLYHPHSCIFQPKIFTFNKNFQNNTWIMILCISIHYRFSIENKQIKEVQILKELYIDTYIFLKLNKLACFFRGFMVYFEVNSSLKKHNTHNYFLIHIFLLLS